MSGESTIRRGVRNARYAAIPNHVFEDTRLTMEARWLLSYLLSKPDNWTVVIGDIVKKGGCGRDRARKMIAELVELGYAEREQQREDGRFGASVLVIFDEPREVVASVADEQQSESVAFLPQPEIPATDLPSPVSPSPVKSAPSNNLDIVITESLGARSSVVRDDGVEARIAGGATKTARADRKKAELEFVKWFSSWGEGDVEFARNAWHALSADERAACVERTPAYIRWIKPAKLMAAAVFLKGRCWVDIPEHLLTQPEKSHGVAKAFGKLWMGLWLEAVSQPADATRLKITAFDERQLELGNIGRDELLRRKRLDHGWPMVVEMRERARRNDPLVTSLALLPLVAEFKPYHRDSDVFSAWVEWHRQHDLPFPDRAPEWIWLPPVNGEDADLVAAVGNAVSTFLSSVSRGRNDDAA